MWTAPEVWRDAIDPRIVILFAGLAVAAVSDIRTHKIPNALTFPLIVVGIAVQASVGDGVGVALTGVGLAFALHFVLYLLGLEGAGDAKLMMAVGAFLGWEVMVEATVWRYMLLLPYGAIVLTARRRWSNFRNALLWTMQRLSGAQVGERPEPTWMPFGPLIAIAVPLAVYTTVLEVL